MGAFVTSYLLPLKGETFKFLALIPALGFPHMTGNSWLLVQICDARPRAWASPGLSRKGPKFHRRGK